MQKIVMVFTVLLTTGLFGCVSSPPTKEAKILNLALAASLNVNKDDQGRPAPLLIKVYELRSSEAFEKADFLDLQGNDTKVLQQDLLSKDEFILQPGAKQSIYRQSNQETQVIGLIAEYRNLGRSVWRISYKVTPAVDNAWYRFAVPRKKVKLKIDYEGNEIKITEINVSK